MSAINTTLTFAKQDLLDKLQERINKIKAESKFAEYIKAVDDAITQITNAGTYTERLAKWHKDVAKGLKDGTIAITNAGGLSGAAPKPKLGDNSAGGRRNYYRGYGNYLTWPVDQLQKEKKRFEDALENQVEPIKTSMELLTLSTDTEVTIAVADYQRMLTGQFH